MTSGWRTALCVWGRWVRPSAGAFARLSGKASWSRQLLDGGLQVERSHSGEERVGAPFRENRQLGPDDEST